MAELTDDEQWVVGELLGRGWLPIAEIERRRAGAPPGRLLPALAVGLAPERLDELRRGLVARRTAPAAGPPVAAEEAERTVVMDLPGAAALQAVASPPAAVPPAFAAPAVAVAAPAPITATVALPPPPVATLSKPAAAATLPPPRSLVDEDSSATLAALPPSPPPLTTLASAWRPGLRLGDLVLREKLGQGAMGAVFLAVKDGTEERFAVKVLPSAEAGSEDVERFRREGLALSSADDHPNVARVHGHGEAHGCHYLVLELLEGGDLDKRLERQGPLPLLEALKVAVQLSRGLAHAHTRGVLHRDLKPANVMFDAKGRAKLVDFGIARVAGQQSLTNTGALLGSPAYMSPEQAAGERRLVDERSDVYGLGAILYAALTGCLPHDGTSLAAVLASVMKEPLVAPSRRRRGVSAAADALVLKAMAKEPDKRYQSARALTDALDALVAEVEAAQEQRRRRALLVPLLALAAFAIGAGGLALGAAFARGGAVAPPASPGPVAPPTAPAPTATVAPPPPPAASKDAPGTDPKGRRGPKALRADLVLVRESSRDTQFAYDYTPVGRPGPTLRMRWIPPSVVELGARHPFLDQPGIKPEVRTVTLRGFFLGETEVTLGQWDTAGKAPRGSGGAKFVDATRTTCGPTADHPVTGLTWDEAGALCADLGGRLPTEAEWEWAARGPKRLHFPWGDQEEGQRVQERANIEGAAVGLMPVGCFPTGRGPFGCDDLTGNAAEWTADVFAPFALLRAAGFHGGCFTASDLRAIPEAAYAEGNLIDGVRPSADVHVYRGGDYLDKADEGWGLARVGKAGTFGGAGVRLALDEAP